jgi:hypothetical protein
MACQIPGNGPIDVHQVGDKMVADVVLTALKSQRNIKTVLDWCLAQSPALELADMVTQDEYTHDFIVPFDDDIHFVYDTS